MVDRSGDWWSAWPVRVPTLVDVTDRSDDGSPARHPKASQIVRWSVAIALLAAVAVVSLLGDHHHGPFTSCSDYVARIGSQPIVTTCHGVSLTDTPTVMALIVVALLLFPDVGGISIAGIIGIKKEIREQRERTEELIRTVSLSQRIHFAPNITVLQNEPLAAAMTAEAKASRFFGDG